MLKPLLVCTLVGITVAGCSSYHPAEYSGDGTMYAIPKGAPRYDLELEPISLMRSGRAEFQLTNLPSENLLALLSVNDPTAEKLAQIDKAGVHVSMTLIDHASNRTSAKSGYLMAEWGFTPESWRSIPAEYEGIWFRSTRHARFTLTVEVRVDHPSATPPVINATTHVRGGGTGTH